MLKNKCLTRYCRRQADEDSMFCKQCKPVKVTVNHEPVKMPYELSCIICSFTAPKPVMLTQKRRNLLVMSGLLRCPECKSPGIELERGDLRVAAMGVRPAINYKKIPRW